MRGPNINTPPSTNRIDLAQSAHRVKSLQSYARRLLRCMSPELVLFGLGAVSDLSPLSGVKRKSDFGAVRAAFDPTQTLRRHSAGDTPVETSQLLIAVLEA